MTFDLETALKKDELTKMIKTKGVPYARKVREIAKIPLRGEQAPFIKLFAEVSDNEEKDISFDAVSG